MKSDNLHESVLVNEVVEALHIEKARKYIDSTVGNGGHTLEILKAGEGFWELIWIRKCWQ